MYKVICRQDLAINNFYLYLNVKSSKSLNIIYIYQLFITCELVIYKNKKYMNLLIKYKLS